MGIVDPVMFVMVAAVHQLVSNKTNGLVSIFINFTVVVLLETCALWHNYVSSHVTHKWRKVKH